MKKLNHNHSQHESLFAYCLNEQTLPPQQAGHLNPLHPLLFLDSKEMDPLKFLSYAVGNPPHQKHGPDIKEYQI